MGRFYQTSDAKFVDNKMFEAPHQLMAQVLQNKDKEIDTEVDGLKANLDKLKLQGLKQDDPAVKKLISEYQDRIDTQINAIKSNPLNYQKTEADRVQIGRDILQDWTVGPAAKIIENKKKYDTWSADLDDKIKNDKKGEYTPDLIAKLKAAKLAEFKETGYNKDTGKYNEFQTEDALALGNLPDILNENIGKYIKADGNQTKFEKNTGQWLEETSSGWKAISPEKLKEAAISYIDATPSIKNALVQRQQYGVEGYEDPNKLLETGIESFVDTNKFKETNSGNNLTANPYELQQRGFNNEQRIHDRDKPPVTELEEIKGETIPNSVGNSAVEAVMNKNTAFTQIKNNKQILFSTIKDPKIKAQIETGDFRNVPQTIENINAIRRIKDARIDVAVQKATEKEFLNSLPASERAKAIDKYGNIIMTTEKKVVNGKEINVYSGIAQKYNVFLRDKNINNEAEHNLSLRQFIPDQKVIDGYNKNFRESMMQNVVPFEFPQGTKILNPKYELDKTGKEPKLLNLSKKQYTPNELYNLGIITASELNKSQSYKTGSKDEENNDISFDIKTADGKTMNYKLGTTIKATGQYGADGKLDYYSDITINGNASKVKINNIKIPEVEQYAANNPGELKAKSFVNRTTAVNVQLVNNKEGKAVYYGKEYVDAAGRRYPKGTIVLNHNGQQIITNANTPEGLDVLSNLLNQ